MHVFLLHASKLQIRRATMLRFKGSIPFKSSLPFGGKRLASNAGLYYVLCPKMGQVFAKGSVEPHSGFSVNPDWITSLLAANKIKYDDAFRECVRTGKHLLRVLPGMARYKEEMDKLQLLEMQQECEQQMQALRRPARRIDEIDRWLALYDAPAMRYKFLVLEGPTSVGKSQFVRSLTAAGRTYEADCSGQCLEPDLRGFSKLTHDVLFFDEASAELVLANKKLFQASSSVVQMARSSTNCHSYQVWAWRIKMVVCSNRWSYELDQLPHVDPSWLIENSVHVKVTEPLWV